MKRILVPQRSDWRKTVEGQGLLYHTHEDGSPYWKEGVAYEFCLDEIEDLERVTNELQQLCIQAVQHVIDRRRYAEFAIPDAMVSAIEESWDRDEVAIYGRFDFAFGAGGPAKLLEYNADTPTALVEAAIAQWFWLQDLFPGQDQFNSIHERLVEAWKRAQQFLPIGPVAFLHQDSLEDIQTVAYLRDTADKAGLASSQMFIEDLGWDDRVGRFVDLDGKTIAAAFKLYPWEFMLKDAFAAHLSRQPRPCTFLEPAWKMILSNKAVLAALWELNPGHPNLLPAYLDGPRDLRFGSFVKKPMFSREGANVEIVSSSGPAVSAPTNPHYGAEGHVFQGVAEAPCLDGFYPILGSWVVDGEAAGLGIRESVGPITDNRSGFVPHCIKG
jgi:glutathionylspermidine synthase